MAAGDQAAIAAVRRYAAALERIRTRLLDAYPNSRACWIVAMTKIPGGVSPSAAARRVR